MHSSARKPARRKHRRVTGSKVDSLLHLGSRTPCSMSLLLENVLPLLLFVLVD